MISCEIAQSFIYGCRTSHCDPSHRQTCKTNISATACRSWHDLVTSIFLLLRLIGLSFRWMHEDCAGAGQLVEEAISELFAMGSRTMRPVLVSPASVTMLSYVRNIPKGTLVICFAMLC